MGIGFRLELLQCISELTKKSLVTSFSYFGEFVEELSLKFCEQLFDNWSTMKIVLENCQYLKKLRIFECDLMLVEVHALQARITMLNNLNELDLSYSTGITKYWPDALDGYSKVEKLTLTARGEITVHFCKYFQNLLSLTIDLDDCNWEEDVFAMIFDQVGMIKRFIFIFMGQRTDDKNNQSF